MATDNAPAPAAPTAGLLAQATPGPRRLRAELEDLVAKELLWPRGGPDEEVTEAPAGSLPRRHAGAKKQLIRADEMDPLAEDGESSAEEGATDALASDAGAMRAFRFANRAMWHQRVHSMLAEAKRAGQPLTLADLDVPENRS